MYGLVFHVLYVAHVGYLLNMQTTDDLVQFQPEVARTITSSVGQVHMELTQMNTRMAAMNTRMTAMNTRMTALSQVGTKS
jgi:roadblock/LC7 domain-containing protein